MYHDTQRWCHGVLGCRLNDRTRDVHYYLDLSMLEISHLEVWYA